MKKILSLFLLFLLPAIMMAQYAVVSPDESVKVEITQNRKAVRNRKNLVPENVIMTIRSKGKTVVKKKEVNLEVKSNGRRRSFGKSEMRHCFISQQPQLYTDDMDDRMSHFGKTYNYMILESVAGITLEVLAFDNGVAYRFSVSGYQDEYKILDICNAFPDDRGSAIFGTFSDDEILPWSVLPLEEQEEYVKSEVEWENPYRTTKVVSWKDALCSWSVGVTIDGITDKKVWSETADGGGLAFDFTYKYLYGGLSFSPCHELLYVYFENDFEPFDGITGSVHAYDVSGRLGFNLPIQTGNDVWSIIPFASASYMNLRQHGQIHPYYHEVRNVDHYLVGVGLKLGYTLRERYMFGFGYERQFFTGKQEPSGRNVFQFSLGHMF